jgi:hypothetical protein
MFINQCANINVCFVLFCCCTKVNAKKVILSGKLSYTDTPGKARISYLIRIGHGYVSDTAPIRIQKVSAFYCFIKFRYVRLIRISITIRISLFSDMAQPNISPTHRRITHIPLSPSPKPSRATSPIPRAPLACDSVSPPTDHQRQGSAHRRRASVRPSLLQSAEHRPCSPLASHRIELR